jgi:membrane protein DedA with SNARE-associated domain
MLESFLSQAGLAAVFLFGFLEACCVPIPSEITFGFGGVLAGEGHLNIVAVIAVGTAAELLGSMVSYSIGRVGGRPLVDKFGRYLLITRADIDRAERFFAGRGAWAVPVGRALPVVRSFVSIVAGFIEVPPALFAVLSLIGTAVWVSAIALIGYGLSGTWNSIEHAISVAGYGIAVVVVVAIAGFIWYRLREVRAEAAAHAAAGAAVSAAVADGSGPAGSAGAGEGEYPAEGGDPAGGAPRAQGAPWPDAVYPGDERERQASPRSPMS